MPRSERPPGLTAGGPILRHGERRSMGRHFDHKQWTGDEDALLMELIAAGMSWRKIGERLGRSPMACKNRKYYRPYAQSKAIAPDKPKHVTAKISDQRNWARQCDDAFQKRMREVLQLEAG